MASPRNSGAHFTEEKNEAQGCQALAQGCTAGSSHGLGFEQNPLQGPVCCPALHTLWKPQLTCCLPELASHHSPWRLVPLT